MQLLKSLFKAINILFPFADFLYILQLEEYQSRRLVRWLPRFFFRRNFQKREKLKLTSRVKLTLLASIGVYLLLTALLILFAPNNNLMVVGFILLTIFIPILVLCTNLILSPFFNLLKKRLLNKAQAKREQLTNLKVIAVAGSFGKTTVKNFLYQLTKYNYRTQMVPGNINTPDGIAAWVLTSLDKSTELLIAEVDAYVIGEIARSVKVLQPQIAVLTNIADQHLERFGSVDNLAKALSETYLSTDVSDTFTTREVLDLITKIGIKLPSKSLITVTASDLKYLNKPFTLEVINNFSASNQINLSFALKVCELLNIPENIILDSVNKLELPDRRQRHTQMFGYEAVDDSYNISFTTAQAGILAAKKLAKQSGKKLLVLTAGIPELSKENLPNLVKLGELASNNADHVVILHSMFAKDIQKGFADKDKYTIVQDLTAFIKLSHQKFPPSEWFLLMQPELGDLYY